MQYFCPKCDQRFELDGTCPEDRCDLLPVETADELVGREIDGRFEVLRLLGQGGMGAVYEARQKSIDRLVALKILKRELMQDATVVKRFLLEAKAASRLSNVHTITIHDYGKTHDGLLYIAMELLKGQSLRERLTERKRLSVDEALALLDQVAESLVEAHSQGIVHRDLKPENIFLATTPEGDDLVKVLDFGIARAQSLAGATHMTNTGSIVGTPAYLSPEVIIGQKADERADVYALGIVLYELLTGQVPYRAETPMQVLMLHVNAEPTPVEAIVPAVRIPRALHRFLWRCLAKDRNERPRDAREFRAQLKKAGASAATDVEDALAPLHTTAEGFRVNREALAMITTKRQAVMAPPPRPSGLTDELEALAPRPRLLPWLLAGGLVLLSLTAALAFSLGRARPELSAAPPVATNASAPAPTPAEATAPATAPAPTPAAATAPAPVAAPPSAPAEVTLTVVSTPSGASVLRGGAEVGSTPWMTRLPRSTEAVTLTLRRPGFEDAALVLTPDRDQVEERTLKPLAKPKPPAPKKRDQVDELMP